MRGGFGGHFLWQAQHLFGELGQAIFDEIVRCARPTRTKCRERYPKLHLHRTAMRAIWYARSAERVVPAITNSHRTTKTHLRSSCKDLYYMASARSSCKNLLEDFTRISTRSSHKDLCKILMKNFMQRHLKEFCKIVVEGSATERVAQALHTRAFN